MSNSDIERTQQRARRRAERAVCAAHPDEFAVRFHEEKHRARVSHIHGPDDPETISWWGEPTSPAVAVASEEEPTAGSSATSGAIGTAGLLSTPAPT